MERRSDYEEKIDFVRRQLIPEMLHDRCFCEAGSREFVELDSVVVEAFTDEAIAQEPTERSDRALRQIYAAEAVVKFSGEAHVFHLFVKLLPVSSVECERAYAAFHNEEMFYGKMTKFYGCEGLPKCYTASLGRYGLPVVVLENLRASGYRAMQGDLREDHLELCVKFLGRFHGRGFALKSRNFQLFREFYAKMLDTTFHEDATMKTASDVLSRLLAMSTSLTPDLREKMARKFVPSLVETARSFATTVGDLSTICHGHFSRRNVLFRSQGDEPIDVKVIDWASMKYCSPAVDFARILLENLSPMNARTKMQRLLEIYVNSVRDVYSEIACDRLKEEILSNFINVYVCAISSLQQDLVEEKGEKMLRLLHSFGLLH